MLVVATCTDHEAADEDIHIRSKYEGGKIVKHRYPISQPNCHAFYRHHFNAIDILNKLSVGPNSVSTVWQTREHMKKFFMCTLAVCETNAYNAYRQFTNRTDMTRAEWKHHLAEELIQYGTARMKKRPASGPSDGSPVTPGAATRRRSKTLTVASSNDGPSVASHGGTNTGTCVLPPAITPGRWMKHGQSHIPNIFSVSSNVAVMIGKATASPAARKADNKKHQGPRGTCEVCRTQIRSVCNICMEPVCNTTVPRKCFAVHFVRHLKALGWTAPK
mmetsp:Transcript_13531/g.34162  ORF Transcript_13531/g.34162 Transcript_13531/m.34162 type:complete len:275 (-) Transcript_13531:78-902(-)